MSAYNPVLVPGCRFPSCGKNGVTSLTQKKVLRTPCGVPSVTVTVGDMHREQPSGLKPCQKRFGAPFPGAAFPCLKARQPDTLLGAFICVLPMDWGFFFFACGKAARCEEVVLILPNKFQNFLMTITIRRRLGKGIGANGE